MALGPLRGPGPDLRCVGLRGWRRGRGEPPTKDKPLEPSEQPLPPPLGSEGGGRRSPRRRVRRTQSAREPRQWTCPLRLRSRVPARLPPRVRAFGRPLPSEADLRAAHSWSRGPRAHSGGSPGMAGTRQVECSDWLKLRTVTLLLEHNGAERPHSAKGGKPKPTPKARDREGAQERTPARLREVRAPRTWDREEAVKEEVRRRTTPTSTTRKTRRKKRLRTTTR